MRALRAQGVLCAVVEKFNPYGGKFGVRQDLFGIVDVLALDPSRGFLGVQCCAGSGLSAHVKKLTEEKAQECIDWLQTPGGCLEIWAWRKLKVKRGGKAVRWMPHVEEITLESLGVEE